MTRLLLPLALAVSLVIPVGGLAMVTAGMAGGASTTSEWDKDELIDDYNQLTRLEEQARPGSAGHIAEARRIAQEALVWAEEHDAEPEWEEFAYATGAMATMIADGIAGLPSFSETRYNYAVDRVNAALAALPPERHP